MGTKENKTIGTRIREIRKNNDMTQEEFAEKIGVSEKTLASWERDIKMPSAIYLSELCKRTGFSADYILGIGMDYGIMSKKTLEELQQSSGINESLIKEFVVAIEGLSFKKAREVMEVAIKMAEIMKD